MDYEEFLPWLGGPTCIWLSMLMAEKFMGMRMSSTTLAEDSS